MKRIGVLAAATLLSVGAMAADNTITATGRMGYFARNNDKQAVTATTPSSDAVEADYFKVKFEGVLNAATTYHFVLNPASATMNTVNSTTNAPNLIDELWLTRTFGESTAVSAGKMLLLIGGRESVYGGADLYQTSAFYTAGLYRAGAAMLSHKMMGQEFKLQIANGNENDKTGTAVKSQSKFGYSALWNGSLMDGMIKPIVSYTVDPTARVSGPNTYLAAGAKFELPQMFSLEADYGVYTQKNASTSGDKATTGTTKFKTESIVGLVRFNGENFQPFVKYFIDTQKADSTKTAESTAYDLGLEYKEAKDDSVRYHLVYEGRTDKTSMNTTEVKHSPSVIYAGVKFSANILK